MTSGFKTVPLAIRAQIDALGSARFVFGASRPFSEELQSRWVDALALDQSEEGVWRGVPDAGLGRWSKWNISGQELVRKDRPKTQLSWSIEAPDFRGAGTHSISFTKDVFQKERRYGRQIEASVVRVDEPRDALVGSVALELTGPYDETMELEYLYAASLARTWFGSATLLLLDDVGVPRITDETFDWTFLPDGTREDLTVTLIERFGSRASTNEIEIMVDRLIRVQSLSPESRLVGNTGFQRYIGYKFGDDFVAFENPRVGNALYLLRGNWQELSQLSRSQLLKSRSGDFDRIIHTANWFEKLRLAVYDYRHTQE
jgi:hypothetical protein